MTSDEAEVILDEHFDRLWECTEAGFRQWRRYPNRPKHRKRTRANIVHDLMMDAVINEFDGKHGCRIHEFRGENERFLIVGECIALWFKKLDRSLKSSNYPTWQALRLKSGQLRLFGDFTILVIGYVLNAEETSIERISITLPNGLKRPHWFIDLQEPERRIQALPTVPSNDRDSMPPRQKVKIKRGEEQKKISYDG